MKNMSMRPSNREFIYLVKNDKNISKVQNALAAYPNLANINDLVGFSRHRKFLINLIIPSLIIYQCNTK